MIQKTHHVKCAHDAFEALRDGLKTAEFRYNDRGYKRDDILVIYDSTEANFREIDTPPLVRTVTHIVNGPAFGIPTGYCMMSVPAPRATT